MIFSRVHFGVNGFALVFGVGALRKAKKIKDIWFHRMLGVGLMPIAVEGLVLVAAAILAIGGLILGSDWLFQNEFEALGGLLILLIVPVAIGVLLLAYCHSDRACDE